MIKILKSLATAALAVSLLRFKEIQNVKIIN